MKNKKRYNIILKNNKNFILASCIGLKFAIKYLQEIKETSKQLAEYYHLDKLPEYEIVEGKAGV